MKKVYLDWAAAAPVSAAAKRAFAEAADVFSNPSSPHAAGTRASQILREARHTIARLTSVQPTNVIFTSGATEANNLAIRGHVEGMRKQGRSLTSMHLLYLPTAHASVVQTMKFLEAEGAQVEAITLADGSIDWHTLKKQIRLDTVLVSLDVVCGETGTRWPVRQMRRVVDETRRTFSAHGATRLSADRRARIVVHADASQAPWFDSLDHTHLGADLITLDAQKAGGLRGIGALIRADARVPLSRILYGGGQESGLRPGTESPALAIAFAAALEDAVSIQKGQSGREDFLTRALRERKALITQLVHSIPSCMVNAGKNVAPSLLNLSFIGRDTDYAVMLLSERGFAVSTKSACETEEEGSRAVYTLYGDAARARSTLRISWGSTTSENELRRFATALVDTIRFLDKTTF